MRASLNGQLPIGQSTNESVDDKYIALPSRSEAIFKEDSDF